MNGSAVFADTSYWIGLINKRDQHHQDAIIISKKLTNMKVVTTELVLTEFLNAMSNSGPTLRLAAAKIVKSIQAKAQIINYDKTPFDPALFDYEKYSDKKWGLVDCASFIIMRNEGICIAASFDEDFKQAGFQTISN